ncbi:MAG: ATP-dependent helicase HrpB, partial [Thermodesulfovibrionales bacterium]
MKTYPIDKVLLDIKEAVLSNQSVILHAPPGAGKTTRVPLALLDIIQPEKGRILMLEPRRIAAVSAARWMAQSIGEEAGQTIGYSIRFDSRTSKKTRIEVVTEGILARRVQADPGLKGVSMVIFDEFHERNLNSDLALSLCMDIQRGLREDLKILVMSATLDCGPVASLLGGAPVITAVGKAFPIEEHYVAESKETPFTERIVNAVRMALKETFGDILVFLPGSGEIRSCSAALLPVVERVDKDITLHPLYADLPFEDQERALLPSNNRKIVLATNIAETSLTIEGVKVVVDSGLTRRLQYDPSTGMNRLITLAVSKASAEQRKGRAGRLGPGVCYRLYSRNAFKAMIPFASPEILVADLSGLVLELAVWGVKDPSSLLWLDAPSEASWNSALGLLKDLGALDAKGSVTLAGKIMAGMPLHPRLARLMHRASELGCASLGADLAALLSERDIIRRSGPGSMVYAKEADIAERIDILRLWRKGRETTAADPWALRAVDRTSRQLIRLSDKIERASAEKADCSDMISRLLLSGFPDRVAKLREDGLGRFLLSQGRGVRLSPMSSLVKRPYIVAVNVDAGESAEGLVHLAAPLEEKIIREECSGRIRTIRRVEWDKRNNRIISNLEERLGSVVLSTKPFNPLDSETLPILCEVIRSNPSGTLNFSREVRQYQGRVALIHRAFTEESWPDFSDECLTAMPEDWLLPWLGNIRTAQGLCGLDILPAMCARLSWQQQHRLDELAPISIVVPSGNRISIDYTSGDKPVLAVKLQEMFGLSDTPVIADGRVKLLLHLL